MLKQAQNGIKKEVEVLAKQKAALKKAFDERQMKEERSDQVRRRRLGVNTPSVSKEGLQGIQQSSSATGAFHFPGQLFRSTLSLILGLWVLIYKKVLSILEILRCGSARCTEVKTIHESTSTAPISRDTSKEIVES